MDLSTISNATAIVISVAALLVSSLIARRQLRTTQFSNDALVSLDWLTRELISEEFVNSEAYVLDRLREEHDPELGVSGLPLAARQHVLRVGRYYASLGQLVAFGIVQERLILSLVHYRLRTAWLAIAPFAEAERKLRGAPFFAFFEHIAQLSAEADVRELHRKLGLKKFRKSTALL